MTELMLKKLKGHIKRTGNYEAITVRPLGEDYQILNGYHRWVTLKELEYEEVKCDVWDVDEKEAKILLGSLNRLRGTDDLRKRAWLIAEIKKDFGDESFTNLVPESSRAIDGLLKFAESDLMDIEAERGVIEQQLENSGIDQEQAKRMANLHRHPSSEPTMKFVFDNETEYNKVLKFFGGVPNTNKLIDLVDNYEADKKGKKI